MNNISGSLTLFDVMRNHGVKNIIFSSSATVYEMCIRDRMIFQISDIIMICGSIVQDVMLMVSVDR